MALRDFAGEASADTAVGVDDLDRPRQRAVVLNRRHQLSVSQQLVLKDRSIAVGICTVGQPGSVIGSCDRCQQAGEIDALGLGQGHGAGLKQIGATDQILESGHPEQAEQLSDFFGDIPEEIDHMLRNTRETLAQRFLLGGHAHRAIIRVADAGHDAALSDHRHGSEAVLLGTQQRCNQHIPTGLQTAVSPEQHTIAQTVLQQSTVHLGETQLPRTTGVLDRTEGRRPGSAVMAGNLNHVSIGLGHASGDGADADLSDQLHAHRSGRMHLMQVVNQLREIFDGIDVVVGRRRDQGHPGLAVAQPCDVVVHLRTGQLTALPWLGPLGHLDFQLLAAAEIFSGDAEAA